MFKEELLIPFSWGLGSICSRCWFASYYRWHCHGERSPELTDSWTVSLSTPDTKYHHHLSPAQQPSLSHKANATGTPELWQPGLNLRTKSSLRTGWIKRRVESMCVLLPRLAAGTWALPTHSSLSTPPLSSVQPAGRGSDLNYELT